MVGWSHYVSQHFSQWVSHPGSAGRPEATISRFPDPVSHLTGWRPGRGGRGGRGRQGFTAAVGGALGMSGKPLRIYSSVKYGSVACGDAAIFMKFPKAGYQEKARLC